MKNKKYHTVRKVIKSNSNISDTAAKLIPLVYIYIFVQIHDDSLPCFVRLNMGTYIPSPLNEMMLLYI